MQLSAIPFINLALITALLTFWQPSIAQDTNYREILNDYSQPGGKRHYAFAMLARQDTSETTSFPEFFQAVVADTSKVTPREKWKFELGFFEQKSLYSEFLSKSFEVLAQPSSNSSDSLIVLNSLSVFYKSKGNYNDAIDCLIQSARIHEKQGDYFESEQTYSLWAVIYLEQKKYSDAITYFKKSFDLNRTYEWNLTPYGRLNNLGLAYHYMNEPDSALICFSTIKHYLENEVPDSLNDNYTKFFLGVVVGNMGDVYLKQGEFDKAEPLLKYDLEQSIIAVEKENACITRGNLADLYLKTGDLDQAKSYLDDGLRIIKENNYRRIKRRYFLLYAKYYEKKGLHKESSLYRDRYIMLNDSITNEILDQRIVNLEADFKVKNAQRELNLAEIKNQKNALKIKSRRNEVYFIYGLAALLLVILGFVYRNYRNKSKVNAKLKTKNNEIELKGQQLEKAVSDKDVLIKEIHHRVKNNLQMITSLLELQTREITDESTIKIMAEGKSRVQTMSLIHNKLYQNDNLAEIDFQEYVEDLSAALYQIYKPAKKEVKQDVGASGILFDIDTAIPLGLIINELLSNSYKYAFAETDHPHLSIGIEQLSAGHYRLTTTDNGKGLPEEVELDNIRSIGLQLVQRLSRQLHGTMVYKNNGKPTFTIDFKDTFTRKLID